MKTEKKTKENFKIIFHTFIERKYYEEKMDEI